MTRRRALGLALAWGAAHAAGCGGLADGDYRGEPLAVIRGALTQKQAMPKPIAPSFALLWAPAADHDALLNLLGGVSWPAPDDSYVETCSEDLAWAGPTCDGTAAQGSSHCDWTDRRLGSLLRVVGFREHILGEFEIAIRDLPPAGARYDLSRQGGRGSFALASVLVFDDEDRDGAFRLGTRENPPEPTLASSARQTYLPGPDAPRRSYLLAYLDGLISQQPIDPAFAEALLFLPQGFSVLVQEDRLDQLGRTTASGRRWQPVEESIELVMPTETVAGCEAGRREIVYLSTIPADGSPTWCSDDRFRATWSCATANGCLTTEKRYSQDSSCAGAPPPAWSCPEPSGSLGSLAIAARTSGLNLDPDGYDVAWRGPGWSGTATVPANGITGVAGLLPGEYQLTLGGVAANCGGARAAAVTVLAGAATRITFDVQCALGGPVPLAPVSPPTP